jgi:phytoene dehydrogenase-like protein
MTNQNNQRDVIVVGAGLAGLTAGATAAASGASTLILEAHAPGGRARTVERDGFVFNMGAHALYGGGPGAAVLSDLGIHPQGTAPPLARYRALAGGEQHLLPTGPTSMLRTTALSGKGKVQLAKLLGRLPYLKPDRLAGLSVAQWLADLDLRPDAEALGRALVRLSTYASDLDEMGADGAIAQLQMAAKTGVIYLDGGWSQLLDALGQLVEVQSGVAVRSLEPSAGKVEVVVDDGGHERRLVAGAVVVAVGGPGASRALFPADPGWPELGPPITAACLDVGVARPPHPGYLLGIDEPLYAATQSPPAQQAPEGQAVMGVLRYGARTAAEDRPQLEAHLRAAGVADADIRVSRFLANMVVAGTSPRPSLGGMAGRPAVTATGLANVYLAGDWVGPKGLLADASLSSGQAAGRLALRGRQHSATMVA